ncbi:phage N-6-adenine-methyltransferase [Zobellella sp. DQSA1]|uniref:phage N-6-adenine-methyltransferase n=1 Tax=Zobellella sp. DQSA1 TaxID=3342386 RepID=UPI0035C03704
MTYFEKLQAMKADRMKIKLRDIGDEWRTPDALYWGIFQLYGPFVLDLFTDGDNAKCPRFYTAEQNALVQPWAEHLDGQGSAFANPPYSRSSYDTENNPVTGMRHIVAKAMAERELGARVVFLIKAAPSEKWWPEHADHICWIKGRVGFDLPDWADHLTGSSAGFGQAIAVFDKNWRGERERYIARDLLEAQGQALMDAIEQRAQELAAQLVPAMGSLSTEPCPIPLQQATLSPELGPLCVEPEPQSSELEPEDMEYVESRPLCVEPAPESPESEPLSLEQVDTNTNSGHHIGGGVYVEPTNFTPDDLHRLWVDGELKTDSFPHFIAALVVMFGRHETYNLRQLRIALVGAEADADNHIWNLTSQQCEQISAFGCWVPKYQINEPSSQLAAVAELVAKDALHSTSIRDVLTQFRNQLQEMTD